MAKMTVKELKLSELVPYDNNPRKNDKAVEAVAESIKSFGFKVPIVIDSDRVIVCGHTRLKAAERLGLEKVPCVIADDLTEDQIKAFRLADNKTAELAEWDVTKLANELDDITTFDMSAFGFDLDALADQLIPELEAAQLENVEEDPFEDIDKLDTHYGVPYQGNKSRIADIIISLLPSGERLVDLFGGGGAITHCAMLSGKWNRFLYNDINPLITQLFLDAINGKYHDERRVITREDFEELKDSDAYVKYIWSFGNNGLAYLWGKHFEAIKQQACRIVLSEDAKARRLEYMKFIKMLKEGAMPSSLERLESLEHLQAITQLEALQRLEALNISYTEYKYQEGDVVYCDVPYEQDKKGSCDDYGVKFDSLEFYAWVKAQPVPVYFSSYEISDDSFYKVKLKTVQSLIGANTNGKKVNEYLYSNRPIELPESYEEEVADGEG